MQDQREVMDNFQIGLTSLFTLCGWCQNGNSQGIENYPSEISYYRVGPAKRMESVDQTP